MRRLLLVLFALACLTCVRDASNAADVVVMHRVDCPAVPLPDSSFRIRQSAQDSQNCSGGYRSLYVIDDLRYGIRWDMVSYSVRISTTAEVITPDDNVNNSPGTQCLAVGPDAAFIDEWFVGPGRSCEERDAYDMVRRRHYPGIGKTCILPFANCALV